MKKSTLIGISILSVFLLCSLSYQPIIAEKPVIELKEDFKYIESEDCGCNSYVEILDIPRPLCSILYSMFLLAWVIGEFFYLMNLDIEELFNGICAITLGAMILLKCPQTPLVNIVNGHNI